MVTLNIDGRKIKVEKGTTILEAIRKLDIDIPTLCYHQDLVPYGACRICMVEVIEGKERRLVASCTFPVEREMTILTDSERIKTRRKMIIEFLLARCPDSKAIRDLARKAGVRKSRFERKDEDCILCGLCVRVCNEIVGKSAIGFINRGGKLKVDTPFHSVSEVCIGCGACSAICPTDAIEMESKAVKRFRESVGTEHKCRYALMGLISDKTCSNNYECWKCKVDQRIRDGLTGHAIFATKKTKVGPARGRFPSIRGTKE